ncbi:PAS domain S-box protein [Mucilaginibacter limnophilus]|uniref:histidine kinase n=1 Tax=Mucilaginibacter limnophilus TaxID=1932778 RepID=A0A437MRN1_9SPHI|nr:PAS domain S-box protein [Mucilaginibacter limnophilus]RVU00299.1 PAS domain S-box protein [Mucilaginibacter limnophilus]
MVCLEEIELLYNSIPTPCIILKPDKPAYTIAAVNKAFLQATFTGRFMLIGKPFFEAFPANADDDGSRTLNIVNAFDHVLRSKKTCLINRHRYDSPSSSNTDEYVRYWNIETYPLLDIDGNVSYIVQSSTDVTALVEAEQKLEASNEKVKIELGEREQAQHALRLSNERHYYVNKATDDAIYDWDMENDHIHWGEAFYRLFGYPNEEEFPLSKWAAMVHPEDILALEDSLNAAIVKPANNNWMASYRLKKRDGHYLHVEENGYILRDEQGTAIRMIGVLRDISGRKVAETELKSLKDTYSDLFQLSPLPMWVYDTASLMFLDVNEAAVDHYGYSKEEFLSMSILDIRPKEDAEHLVNIIRSETKPRVKHMTQARHLKKSGELIIVSTKGNSIRYGAYDARMVVVADITEKIKAEQELLKSERRFKKLIQEGADLIAIVDAEGNYIYVSSTAKPILGMEPRAFVGKNAFAFVHEEDRQAVMQQFEALNHMKRLELKPFRFIDSNNRTHWIETVVTDMRDDDAIEGIVCNSRVVTERVEKEMKLKEHLDRYNAVSKATSDSIWDVDMSTGRILWNHGIKGIFGYDDVHYDLQWWRDRVHPDDVDRVVQTVDQHMNDKTPRWTSEYRFRCADGNYKYVLDRGFLIFDERHHQPVRMIGAMQDVSERMAYTKAIEEHNIRLREIAWTQSHLVRAPLARILGLVQLLKDPKIDDCSRQIMLSYLNTSAADLDKIIESIIKQSYDALNNC